jgi:linoleoyl-CoA desaturase
VITGVDCDMFWFRHVHVHHRFTNVYRHDGDISQTKIFRASPFQPWSPAYRLQHFYIFALYGLMVISWTWISDFNHLFDLKISDTMRLPKWTPASLSRLFLRKIAHTIVTIAIPLYVLGPGHLKAVLLCYCFVFFIVGILVALILQVSHVNAHGVFYEPGPLQGPFTSHQFTTTLSYGVESRWLTWYLAGVNLHLEHHMFPAVSHRLLPEVSKILKETCRENGIRYPELPSFQSSVVAHYQWLKIMSLRPEEGIKASERLQTVPTSGEAVGQSKL